MKVLTYAPDAVRLLNGIFCVYKPAGLFPIEIRRTLIGNLIRDLNCLETRPPKDYVSIEGSVDSGKPFCVKVAPSYADHPLVVGPRYQPQDFRCVSLNYLGKNMSGILLYAVNRACGKSLEFRQVPQVQVIEVKGKFGFATQSFFHDGKVVEKSSYRHIRQVMVDRVIASIQASHQADAFKYAGVEIQSQEAYELACQGIVKPEGKSEGIIYNMCCTEFNLPYFTFKIHCINVTEEYLASLVHQIGIYVRSTAVCTQLRQMQYGSFLLDHALLRKHWTLEHIISNMFLCRKILGDRLVPSADQLIKPANIDRVMDPLEEMQREAKEDMLC